jgi:uncharacterized membrane protein YjjP (DUF1212 family)
MPGIATYARIAGVVLLGVAAAGLLIPGWEAVAIVFHAGVALFYLYVGFSRQEAITVRQMVGGLGVLLVVAKTITILSPLGWGGPPQHGPVEVTCLVLGVTSILAARYLPDRLL